jgi:hypothetical protein
MIMPGKKRAEWGPAHAGLFFSKRALDEMFEDEAVTVTFSRQSEIERLLLGWEEDQRCSENERSLVGASTFWHSISQRTQHILHHATLGAETASATSSSCGTSSIRDPEMPVMSRAPRWNVT